MNKCSIMGWYCPWSTQKDHTWVLTSQHSFCDKTNAIQPQIKKWEHDSAQPIWYERSWYSLRDQLQKKWPRATIRATIVVEPEARMQLTRSEKLFNSSKSALYYIALTKDWPCVMLTWSQLSFPRTTWGRSQASKKRLLVDFSIRRYLLEGLS